MALVLGSAACHAPERPSTDEIVASAPDHGSLMESARQQLDKGDAKSALDDLIHAAELAETADDSEAIRCPFAESTTDIADRMVEREHHAEARLAYAVAVRFAEDCPHLDRAELQSRQQLAANAMRAVSAP